MSYLERFSDILVVGLTGQTGAGKSTVSKLFSQNGFSVIDADMVSRDVVKKGSQCLEELADLFGNDIISHNGELNRSLLGDIVFTNPQKLEALSSIIYPYITQNILTQIKKLEESGKKLILLDAPTLFESRADDFCDLVISVIAREDIREKRIIARDNITPEQAKNRMNSQNTEEFFKEYSDYYIKNNGSFENVYSIANEVIDKIKNYYNIKTEL